MSTLRILKDNKHGKRDQIVTVPFLEANKLVADGFAARMGQSAPSAPQTVGMATYEKLGAKVGELETKLKIADEQREELNQEIAKHLGTIGKLEAENQKLNEQVVSLQKAAAATSKK